LAVATLPTAPSLKTTLSFAELESKPKPAITMLVELAGRLPVFTVTTGVTIATCTAAPLLTLLVVTMAVRLPALVGFVEDVTVSEVGLAVVTLPTAPSLKVTLLLVSVLEKPKPAMVMVAALAARLAVFIVTTGVTVATWTAPLATPLVVTLAVKLPALVGLVEKGTVSDVALAVETVPIAPSLKATVLLPAVLEKPKPLMMICVALAARLLVFIVTTGVTVATWTAAPLERPFVSDTIAVRFPAVGGVLNDTVNWFAMAFVTVPVAPRLNVTVLFAAVVEKLVPLMMICVALAARLP